MKYFEVRVLFNNHGQHLFLMWAPVVSYVCVFKVVWIEKELEPFIGVKMMNINCAISDCGLWVVNYANMGCFLPVKALFWGWETIKTCVFCTQNVCNVTVRNWNISRLAWPNAMKFFVGGNRHYIFDFMWFLSQSRWWFLWNFKKSVFWRFFVNLTKTTICYQKSS